MNNGVTMKSIRQLLAERGLQDNGPVQKFVDSEVIGLSDPLVPFRGGPLKNSAQAHTVIGSGNVMYKTPYARVQYYKNHRHYSNNSSGQRGSKWFERMKAMYLTEILEGAKKISGSE